MSNIHYFELITTLSFKIKTKISSKTTCDISIVFVGKVSCDISIVFVGKVSFTTGNFNPKLSSGFEAISI